MRLSHLGRTKNEGHRKKAAPLVNNIIHKSEETRDSKSVVFLFFIATCASEHCSPVFLKISIAKKDELAASRHELKPYGFMIYPLNPFASVMFPLRIRYNNISLQFFVPCLDFVEFLIRQPIFVLFKKLGDWKQRSGFALVL